jgi:hypothetical protein
MATKEFFIREWDQEGGSGANFLLEVKRADGVKPPLVEAVMAGSSGNHGFAFTSKGEEL